LEKITKAIIVAAGEGSRLRPVTLTTPKPLIKVNGTRMIDTSIRALKNNGIHEIYIVCGYKKELFMDAFKDDPEITLIENPHYLEGNNVTSLYAAKDHLPGSFVLEGDLIIYNDEILSPEIEKSGYCANWEHETSEWALSVSEGRIQSCETMGGTDTYRLWGVSMWTEEDGKRLAELIRVQFEELKEWNVYWDELALLNYKDSFDLGIRVIDKNDIIEIDSFRELVEADPSYENFK